MAYSDLREQADAVWQAVTRPSRPLIVVQHGTSSIASGAEDTFRSLLREVEQRRLSVDVDVTGCNGLDYLEPIVHVVKPDGTRILYANITASRVPEFLDAVIVSDSHAPEIALAQLAGDPVEGIPAYMDLPIMQKQVRRLMERVGLINPESIDHYIATGGYEAVNNVLTKGLTEEQIIKEALDSGLWGRGGAAFPTGRKWDFLRTARGDVKYLVCNADEGDAGAWVNRVLMEGDPHSVLEGMLIAALATGAARSVFYIREEYPLSTERVQRAIDQMQERGLLGENILGTDFSHEIVLVRGAGSYVCGEETGLIASAEGQRGMPKIKPPFPAQAGVFGKPTNVNNVETYANVPLIFRHGAQWYRGVGTNAINGTEPVALRESPQADSAEVITVQPGTRLLTVEGPNSDGWFAVVHQGRRGWVPGDLLRPANTGSKMFTVSGNVQHVACVEVPLGTPTSTVVNELCGGVPRRRTMKGVQPGGALGGLFPAAFIDMTLEPESYREKRVLMGSGGLVIMDDTACIIDMCIYVSGFAEDESCGRCTTCHGGTQRMTEILRRIAAGGGRESDFDHLRLLGETMRWANCVHGQAAPTAIMNSLQYFMDEYIEHVFNKRCPAKVCPALVRYHVDHQAEAVAAAAEICPTEAIVKRDGSWIIDQEKCIKCSACVQIAPRDIRRVDATRLPETELTPVGR